MECYCLSLRLRLRHFRKGLDLKCRELVVARLSRRVPAQRYRRILDTAYPQSLYDYRCQSSDLVATNACPNPGRITSTGASRARCPARVTRRSGWCQFPSSTLSFESIRAVCSRSSASAFWRAQVSRGLRRC